MKNQKKINCYKQLKKDLCNKNNYVIKSKNRLIDFIIFDIKQDIQLYKLVFFEDKENVNIWINKLKEIYIFAWYKANYNLVFLDKNLSEIRREKIILN